MDILGCQTLSKSLLDEIDCKRLDVLADSRQIDILEVRHIRATSALREDVAVTLEILIHFVDGVVVHTQLNGKLAYGRETLATFVLS